MPPVELPCSSATYFPPSTRSLSPLGGGGPPPIQAFTARRPASITRYWRAVLIVFTQVWPTTLISAGSLPASVDRSWLSTWALPAISHRRYLSSCGCNDAWLPSTSVSVSTTRVGERRSVR